MNDIKERMYTHDEVEEIRALAKQEAIAGEQLKKLIKKTKPQYESESTGNIVRINLICMFCGQRMQKDILYRPQVAYCPKCDFQITDKAVIAILQSRHDWKVKDVDIKEEPEIHESIIT